MTPSSGRLVLRLLQSKRSAARAASMTRRSRRRSRPARRSPRNVGRAVAGGLDPRLDAVRLDNPIAQHQSRYLTDEGRLFFDSADALGRRLEQDPRRADRRLKAQVGVENVYEYEPEGLGSCTHSRLHLADLLGHLSARIGLPGRKRKRR